MVAKIQTQQIVLNIRPMSGPVMSLSMQPTIQVRFMSGHIHPIADVAGLQEALDSKATPEWVIEQIQQSIQPAEKDVVNCQVVDYLTDDGFPEVGENNKYYADSDSGVVKKYTTTDGWEDCGEVDENSYYICLEDDRLCAYGDEGWEDITGGPSSSVIYVATTPEFAVKMYLWNDAEQEWQDVTGEKVDDTIYVNNLTTALEGYTEKGYYLVCYSKRQSIITLTKFYTFIVDRTVTLRGKVRTTTIYQSLADMEGYKKRNKTNSNAFTEWEDFTYSYEGHTHAISDITSLQTKLQELEDLACAGL